MIKSDKKGLRARLDDIYKWSVKSGVAVATPNSLKVQWDKVIEELNETLLHIYFDDKRKLVDDIGDIFISFINLLNINPKNKKGVFEQNAERMGKIAAMIKQSSSRMPRKFIDKDYVMSLIFEALRESHRLKRQKTISESELFLFADELIFIYLCLGIKESLRNCIYSSYCEIQGRQYEIRVR